MISYFTARGSTSVQNELLFTALLIRVEKKHILVILRARENEKNCNHTLHKNDDYNQQATVRAGSMLTDRGMDVGITVSSVLILLTDCLENPCANFCIKIF